MLVHQWVFDCNLTTWFPKGWVTFGKGSSTGKVLLLSLRGGEELRQWYGPQDLTTAKKVFLFFETYRGSSGKSWSQPTSRLWFWKQKWVMITILDIIRLREPWRCIHSLLTLPGRPVQVSSKNPQSRWAHCCFQLLPCSLGWLRTSKEKFRNYWLNLRNCAFPHILPFQLIKQDFLKNRKVFLVVKTTKKYVVVYVVPFGTWTFGSCLKCATVYFSYFKVIWAKILHCHSQLW